MNIIAVIPCRYASTRLPGKPLLKIKGKTIIEHVYRGVAQSSQLAEIVIATDDKRIFEVARGFGGKVTMTRGDHATGTDRIGEVIEKLAGHFDCVLNIQGDEPLVDGECVGALIKPFLEKRDAVMSTLCTPITSLEDLNNPNVVKVVRDKNNKALYFSRFPLPYCRPPVERGRHLRHVGLYGFKTEFLLKYKKWPQTELEKSESLEQLRALENGFPIYLEGIDKKTVDVNTAADLKKAEKLL